MRLIKIEEDDMDIDDLIEDVYSPDKSKDKHMNKPIVDKYEHMKAETENQEIVVKNAFSLVKEMNYLINHISYAKRTLKNELRILNKAQEELLFKIESDKFTVVEGYRLVKEIKEIRAKRRAVKNNLCIYETLERVKIPKSDIFDNALSKAESIEGEIRYNPRILKDINYKFNDNKNSKFKDIVKSELLSWEQDWEI